MDMSDKARAIKSDETMIEIVDVLAESGETTISEIADSVGKSKSTVYFHLATMEQRGLVVKTDEGFRLGLRFLDLGILVRDQQPLFPAVKPKVEELAEETGEKAWCFVEERGKLVYLYGAEGEHPARTHSRVGQREDIHTLAAGKAMLAHMEESRSERILDHHGLSEKTNHTITQQEELNEELEAIRERGIAFNMEESIAGMRAVSAPIKKEDGGVYGAISVSGPAKRLTREKLEDDLGQLVLGVANEIEINLRYD